MPDIDAYVAELNAALSRGDDTEHTHRPALKAYLESYRPGRLVATNEPRRAEAGAPDYGIRAAGAQADLGKVEAKQIAARLDRYATDSERTEPRTREGAQLKRYRAAYDNLLLTDYVTFVWYRPNQPPLKASLGAVTNRVLVPSPTGPSEVQDLVEQFLAAPVQRIRSAPMLARRMARLTDLLREVVTASLQEGTASDTVKGLHAAFRQVLVPDLSVEQFADMFSQTLSYGLFAARVGHADGTAFVRASAAHDIPRTNPFLRELFTTVSGPALDEEPYVGIVDDLAALLDASDMLRVLRDFGNDDRPDPIVHFYETFLAAYDQRLRDIRGVYYTPAPVVGYIVRLVDALLSRDLAVPDGLADTSRDSTRQHRVLVLDPACGTGTFLYSVVDLVRDRIGVGNAGVWSPYVREHLLPRLFGFELMMAPYAVAHLKLGMQLAGLDLPEAERGALAYDFASDDRQRVFLTNALEAGEQSADMLLGAFLSREANAAAEVKNDKPIMVVLGNPPYQGSSANPSWRLQEPPAGSRRRRPMRVPTFIGELLADYYTAGGAPLRETNTKWLQDDYVKFLRFGQWRIDQTGQGILAFVTNHTYLDAPTFRGMRESLLRSFDDIYIVDLHGNMRRRETAPDGSTDEGVFDAIQQGVAIAVFVKRADGDRTRLATVHHHDEYGLKDDKYAWLDTHSLDSTDWTSYTPAEPSFSFRPQDSDLAAEWELGTPLTDLFPLHSSGIVTSRDSLVVDSDPQRLRDRIALLTSTKPDDEVRTTLFGTTGRTTPTGIHYKAGDNRDWTMTAARAALKAAGSLDGAYRQILYRPFDTRTIFYHRLAVDNMHSEVMSHMTAGPNLGLVSARTNKSPVQDQFLATTLITEAKTGESTTQSALFPLWRYPQADSSDGQTLMSQADVLGNRVPNLGTAVAALLADRPGLALVEEPRGDLQTTAGVEDVFHYVYGLVHAREYRLRYADFLRGGYARVPFPASAETFAAVAGVGERLVAAHTLAAAGLGQGPGTFPVPGTHEIAPRFPRWTAAGTESPDGLGPHPQDRLYVNADGAVDGTGQYFADIDQETYEFTIGGHPVLDKWLKSRRGDRLGYEDLLHVRKTVGAIKQTVEAQDELDDLLPVWPLP